jgi:hypothetical protein
VSWRISFKIDELFRLLYGVSKVLSLSIIGAGVSWLTLPLDEAESVEIFLTAGGVSFSWIVRRFGFTRGCDSFSRNATNASVRLTLLFRLSLDPPLENHPLPPPPDFSPIFVHSMSLRFKTFAISLRIWVLAVALGAVI